MYWRLNSAIKESLNSEGSNTLAITFSTDVVCWDRILGIWISNEGKMAAVLFGFHTVQMI